MIELNNCNDVLLKAEDAALASADRDATFVLAHLSMNHEVVPEHSCPRGVVGDDTILGLLPPIFADDLGGARRKLPQTRMFAAVAQPRPLV